MTARTDLVVVDNGAMNADGYIRNILEEHVVPFALYIGENFIFMDDNARPHRARIVQEYLEEVEVTRMELRVPKKTQTVLLLLTRQEPFCGLGKCTYKKKGEKKLKKQTGRIFRE